MRNYVLRRIVQGVFTVFGVMLLTFVLFRLLPTDFAAEELGAEGNAATLQDLRWAYGLEKPLFLNTDAWRSRGWSGLFDAQFPAHIHALMTLDFGRSWKTRQKVSTMLLKGVVPSLSLMVPIFFGLLAASITLGLVAAHHYGSLAERALTFTCLASVNIPMLAYILILQYLLAYRLNLFPVFGYDGLRSLVLPVLIGILAGLGGKTLFYRTLALEESRQFFVTAARAKGLSRYAVLKRHVLSNIWVPILGRALMTLPFLFMGSLLLERFFGIPGVGEMMLEGIQSRDYAVVNAITFISALICCFWSIVVDLCCARMDPRIVLK
jgi:peptide/nickel transport system permease protein